MRGSYYRSSPSTMPETGTRHRAGPRPSPCSGGCGRGSGDPVEHRVDRAEPLAACVPLLSRTMDLVPVPAHEVPGVDELLDERHTAEEEGMRVDTHGELNRV